MNYLDELKSEFLTDEGFFAKMHRRHFDRAGAERALRIVKKLELTQNHGENYELLHYLFGIDSDFEGIKVYHPENSDIDEYQSQFFRVISEIFGRQLLELARIS